MDPAHAEAIRQDHELFTGGMPSARRDMHTAICECGHHWSVHAQSGLTAASAVCHGYAGSATPGPLREPCACRGFAPWAGPVDSRTGEPVRPLTMTIDAHQPPQAALGAVPAPAPAPGPAGGEPESGVSPAETLARQVQDHIAQQPWSMWGNSPVPVEINFDARSGPGSLWSVRFVRGLTARYGHPAAQRVWAIAYGPTITAALEAARAAQERSS
jgi:hypothetical protein